VNIARKQVEWENSLVNKEEEQAREEVQFGMYPMTDTQTGQTEYLSRAQMNDLLMDGDFIDTKLKTGAVELGAREDDQAMADLIEKQKASGTKLGDFGENLLAGVYDVAGAVTGFPKLATDVTARILGIPEQALENMNMPSFREASLSKDVSTMLKKKAEQEVEKNREYNSDFTGSIANGDFGEAAIIGMNQLARSAPTSALFVASTMATGGTNTFLMMAPIMASGTYAEQFNDPELSELSKDKRLARAALYGTFEAGFESIGGLIASRYAKTMFRGLRGIVRTAGIEGGEEAATAVAKSLAEESAKNIMKTYGIDALKEGGTEVGTTVSQMMTDNLLGITDKSMSEITKAAIEAGAIGTFIGGVQTSPAVGVKLGTKKYQGNAFTDQYIEKFGTKGLKEKIDMAVKEGGISEQEGEKIKSRIDSRDKAVNAVPETKKGDTEVIDLIQEKQDLKEQAIKLDDAFKAPVEERIQEIDAEIQKEPEATKEEPKTETPTKKTEKPKDYEPPLKFTSPTDEKYAISTITGKPVMITKAEYDAEIASEKPVAEKFTTVPVGVYKPTLEISMPENLFDKRLVELGYEKSDIDKMTMEQKQEIVLNKTQASKSEDSAKVNSVKENAKQQRLAEMYAELDDEAKPTPTTQTFLESLGGTPVKDLSETVAEGVFQTEVDGADVLMSEVDGNTVKLESIKVPKKERGQGKAKAALKKITDEADKQGKAIVLDVVPENEDGGRDVFYTGRGKKFDNLSDTKGEFVFFSQNKKNSEWYGGDEANVTEAFIDDAEYLDLTTQEKKAAFVEENFTNSDIELLYKSEIKNALERDRFGSKTKKDLLSKWKERAKENAFSGGKEQAFLLEKAKSLGVKGIKLLDRFFGKNDISTIAIDKSTIETASQPTTEEGLRKLYEQAGFVPDGGKRMRREANAVSQSNKQTPATATKEVKPEKISESESNKETTPEQKLSDAKQRLERLKQKRKDSNRNLGIIYDPKKAGRKMAQDDIDLFNAYLDVAKAYIENLTDRAKANINDFAKEVGEKVSDVRQVWDRAVSETEKDAKKKSGPRRKKSYPARQLKEYSGQKELKDAIEANGLTYEPVSWKKVLPMANEIVAGIFSGPDYKQNAQKVSDQIAGTSNQDYRDNHELSTLHSLIAHAMLARFQEMGDIDSFQKWSKDFDNDSRHKGRFISAMQHDASPYAIVNNAMKPFLAAMDEAMQKTPEGSDKQVSEIIDGIKEKLKLSEEEIQRLNGVISGLKRQGPTTTTPSPSTPRAKKGRAKVKEGLSDLRKAIRKAGGQLNVGGPINDEILSAIAKIVSGTIEEGVYQASKIKKAVMGEVSQISSDPDFLSEIESRVDEMLSDPDTEASMNEAMTEAFVEKLEQRAKSNIKQKGKVKSAEQVLLDSLLSKVNETIKKEATPKKSPIDRLKEAIENREFSDEVWKAAMENVSLWLDSQPSITPEKKAEILASMQDSVAGFMETPFAKSDLRRAIKEGSKDLNIEISKVVKEHWTKQGEVGQTLTEKLISDLGLTASEASKFADRINQEVADIFKEAKLTEIKKALGLDPDLKPKTKKDHVNQRVSDRIMAAINLGMLDDTSFRGMFAEKYGFTELTPQNIRDLKRFNDLINLHQGTEMSRQYEKQLMDSVVNMKPWEAQKSFNTMSSMLIRGLLNSISTIGINIPVGSVLAYGASNISTILGNPVATALFMKEFKKAGLSGIGRKSFLSTMGNGFNYIDEGSQNFDERTSVRGDQVDYWLNNLDLAAMSKDISGAKDPAAATKAIVAMLGRSLIMVKKISNYAQAFDALITYKGTELDQFINIYKEEAKAAGESAKFNPEAGKRILDAVKKKMAYDPETKLEIEEKVNAQIEQMKIRNEKVPSGLKERMMKAEMESRRDADRVKESLERVKSFMNMEKPSGIGGFMYDIFIQKTTINEKDGWGKAIMKFSIKIMLGLFLRISITSMQKAIENIPLVGLGFPGIFYDLKQVPKDPLRPKGPTEWKWGAQNPIDRRRKLATHALMTGLLAVAAANMFRFRDDEDENGKKKRVLELNPDRWIDITGWGTGEYFNNEQLTETVNGVKTRRRDYTISIRTEDGWVPILPARFIPHLIPMVSLLGGMRDESILRADKFKDSSFGEQVWSSMNDLALSTTALSFATIPKNIEKVIKGIGYNKEPIDMFTDFSLAAMSTIVTPTRAAIYDNFYRDIESEFSAFVDADKKSIKGFKGAMFGGMSMLEEMMGEPEYDIFGNSKKRTSKLIRTAEELPSMGYFIDNATTFGTANEDRYSTQAWQLKQQYRPNVIIEPYYPRGIDPEFSNLATKYAGEKFNELWVDPRNRKIITEAPDDIFEELIEKMQEVSKEYAKEKIAVDYVSSIQEEYRKSSDFKRRELIKKIGPFRKFLSDKLTDKQWDAILKGEKSVSDY